MAYVVTQDERRVDTPSAALATIANVIWYLFAIVDALLLFRLLLKFIGVGSNFLYSLTTPFVAPFAGILGSLSFSRMRGVLELDALLAMLVFWLVAVVLTALLRPRYSIIKEDQPIIVDRRRHDERRPDYEIRG